MAEPNPAENDDPRHLRKQAEQTVRHRLKARSSDSLPVTGGRLAVILHELEVHQVELEMQNEELRRAQRELEASRDRYADLYDFAPVGYVTLTGDGRIAEANLTASTMLGVPRDYLLGRPLFVFVVEDDRQVLSEHLRRCGAEGTGGCQVRLRARNGSPTPVRLQSAHYDSCGKDAPAYRTAVTDVSALKEMEGQLKALNADLERRVAMRTAEANERARQLRVLAEQLARAEQRERRRLASVVHDKVQQSLVAARMAAARGLTAARSDATRARFRELDELIAESVETLRTLSTDLCPPILHEARLPAALEWLAGQMRHRHGLSVTLHADAGEEIGGEEIRGFVFEAVRELLFNVVKHAETESAEVRTGRADGMYVRITVADRGVGFDPRSPHGADGKGEGFGLFAIRERMEMLGGRLEIDSAPGAGARMTLVVPSHA